MYFHQNGETPLICAADNGHSEAVKLLLEAGALIEAKDNVSKWISIFTYMCVCGERGGGGGGGVRGGVIFHHTVWWV